MAEIRKFNPADGNAIQQALKAALGEPVRPHEPGAHRTPAASGSQAVPQPTPGVVTFTVRTTAVEEDERD